MSNSSKSNSRKQQPELITLNKETLGVILSKLNQTDLNSILSTSSQFKNNVKIQRDNIRKQTELMRGLLVYILDQIEITNDNVTKFVITLTKVGNTVLTIERKLDDEYSEYNHNVPYPKILKIDDLQTNIVIRGITPAQFLTIEEHIEHEEMMRNIVIDEYASKYGFIFNNCDDIKVAFPQSKPNTNSLLQTKLSSYIDDFRKKAIVKGGGAQKKKTKKKT
jgi:hypothetical protein